MSDPAFRIGNVVEKHTGEARWFGVVLASYLTCRGGRRYVVDVAPQGFQMIATPSQLRLLARSEKSTLDLMQLFRVARSLASHAFDDASE